MSPTSTLAPRAARPDAPVTLPNDTSFADLGVPDAIVAALARQSIHAPFPIQVLTLRDSLAGRHVLGRGSTGSGKTLAFAIPVVAALAAAPGRTRAGHPRALVLVPTRELATQVAKVITPLAAAMSLRCATVFGGVGQGNQVAALRSGVDIVVACPGRLEDLIQQGHCSLGQTLVTVLDEADHMADLGFLPVVRRLLDATPKNAQRLLFSATLDNGVDALVTRFIHDPAVHVLASSSESRGVVEHHVLSVRADDKQAVVRDLAVNTPRLVLFTRTKHGAKKLAKQLSASGIDAHELHGNLSQAARDRNLASFASGTRGVLVATDVAARGIHVDDIDLVVHVDPPVDHKAYLHRSGRTARAGASGVVAILMTPDQAGDVRRLTRAAGVTPTDTKVSAGHPLLSSFGAASPQRHRQERQGEVRPTTRPAVTAAATGIVKFFHAKRGFGFISRDGADDVFVHASNLVPGTSLAEGQRVAFELGRGRKGDEATQVTVV